MGGFRSVAIASLVMFALTARGEAQMAGTLDLQTNCEHGLAGVRTVGNNGFQLPVAGG